MKPASSLPTFSPDQARKNRKSVRKAVLHRSPNIKTGSIKAIGGADLRILYDLYDRIAFDGRLAHLLEEAGAATRFDVSNRLTSSGANIRGRALGALRIYEIAVSAPVLFTSFSEPGTKFSANGIVCADRLESLLVLMEHELVHLYEMLTLGASGHGESFQKMAHGLFGHTDYRHGLLTPRQHAVQTYSLRTGDTVTFSFEGERLVGTITRITKRATVLVPPPDTSKQTVMKYLVPLGLLSKVDDRAGVPAVPAVLSPAANGAEHPDPSPAPAPPAPVPPAQPLQKPNREVSPLQAQLL